MYNHVYMYMYIVQVRYDNKINNYLSFVYTNVN